MKIPKVTKEEPYIEFKYTKKGTLKLAKTSNWWGGINSGFVSSNGEEGNTCLPEDLEQYIEAFNQRIINEITAEIKSLEKKLRKIKKRKF